MLMAALCSVVLSCAPGCRVIRYYFPSDEIEMAMDDPRDLRTPEPINSVSTLGLEVRLWVVDDTDRTAARLLSSYERTDGIDYSTPSPTPSPIPPAMAQSWSQWGFRLIAIPIDEVEGFLDTLIPIQPISVHWLGEFGKWRAIVRAGELSSNHVRVGERSVQIERGRPRLIARSWIEPILTPDAVVPGVRLDLGVQIQSNKNRSSRQRTGFGFDENTERSIEDDGPVFDELIMSAMLDGSHAIILVGEAPDVDWNSLPDPESLIVRDTDVETDSRAGGFGPSQVSKDDGDGQDDRQGDERGRTDIHRRTPAASRAVNEPGRPKGRTLGELMLTSPGSRTVRINATRIKPKRVIVVFIPRVEGGYTLLSTGQSVQLRGDQP